MPKLLLQPQLCNNPLITEQEVGRARAALGINPAPLAANANVQVENPRRQKRNAGRDTLRRDFARKFAASAFKAARWGGA